ncbi:MAG: ArsR family transcriptional regulator [Halobacteria archaeon]
MKIGIKKHMVKPVLSDTRIKILKLLLLEDLWPKEIAEQLRVEENAIRRHLDFLEKEGLVVYSFKKTGSVGRPLKVYQLTDKAKKLEVFPKQYERALLLLLLNIIKLDGKDHAVLILSEVARDIARLFSSGIPLSGDFETKCRALARVMDDFGSASYFKREGDYCAIYEYNCVFNEIARVYGDLICNFMDKAIKEALGGNVLIVREKCMAKGDRMCKRLIKQLAPTYDQRDRL